MAQSNINIWNQQKKRASVPGPRANVTIEAAFAIPFFLFGILCLIYLMEIQAIRGSIHTAALNAAKSAAEISSHRSLLTLTLPSESLMMANRLPSASSSRKQTCPARTQNTGTLHQARFASFKSTAPFHCCPAAFPPQISSPMSGASTPHPRSGPATTASPHIPYRRPMRPSALRESESCSQTGRIG